MPTALLSWELGGGAGHCANLAPIAERFTAGGWEVWAAVQDLVTARRVMGHLPIRFLQAPLLVSRTTRPVHPARTFAHILHNTGFGDDAQLGALVDAWDGLLRVVQPDVLVCEHAPVALLASRPHDLKRFVLGTGFFCPPDSKPLPNLRYWENGNDESSTEIEDHVLERANRWLRKHSTPPMDRLSRLYADVDETFLLTFPELDHYPTRCSSRYWGMWSWSPETKPSWPEGDGLRVFAYLKQMPSKTHMAGLLMTLRECNRPSLVYVAGGDPVWLQRFQTPRLRFSHEPVNMAEVAQQCDLAVLNGNAGAATTLLLAGVPQLHIPLYLEQEVFAKRMAEIGASLHATPDRPEQIAIRLQALIHEFGHYRESALRFAGRYSGFNAETSICEIAARIEAHCVA